jgi:hypothetical protein
MDGCEWVAIGGGKVYDGEVVAIFDAGYTYFEQLYSF